MVCSAFAIAQSGDEVSLLLLDEEAAPGQRGFCTPGVANKSRARGLEIVYTRSGGGVWQNGNDKTASPAGELQSLESINLRLRVPVLLKPDLKILLGYQYRPQRYNFQEIGSEIHPFVGEMNNESFKSNAFSLYLTKSFDETYYTAFRLQTGFNGAYDNWINFDSQYLTISAIGLLGIKKHKDFEWGFGMVYSRNIRRTLVLPFVMLNKNFNDRWGFEAAPPAYVLGRYNANPETILLFGAEYNSSIYAIEPNGIGTLQANRNTPSVVYSMNNRSFSAVISLERQLIPWVWLNIKGGYLFNLNSHFEIQIPDTDQTLLFQPPNAPFLQMGIFLSPPDKLMR